MPHAVCDREIDCRGDILMPAFINAHTHTAMTLFRGVAEDMRLHDWLFKRIFPLENNLTDEDVFNGTMLGIAEYIKSGITTFADMYYYPDAIAGANNLAGTRCVLVSGANDIDGGTEKKLETVEAVYQKYSGGFGTTTAMLGCHAEYTCSEKFLEGLVALSYKYKAPLYTHISETLEEVGECTVRHSGLTPPMYLHKLGFFENGATLAHGVHLDKEDIALLAQSGVSIASCPSSNLKLGSGVAPVYALNKSGVNIALGTDGAASNNALDPFREMYLASVLQKMSMSDASAVPAASALKMATVNGAKALGLNNLGVLKAGYKADIIRLDASVPEMQPDAANISHIVYSAGRANIKMTMSAGKILYENGAFTCGINMENITKNARKSLDRLVKKAKLS